MFWAVGKLLCWDDNQEQTITLNILLQLFPLVVSYDCKARLLNSINMGILWTTLYLKKWTLSIGKEIYYIYAFSRRFLFLFCIDFSFFYLICVC